MATKMKQTKCGVLIPKDDRKKYYWTGETLSLDENNALVFDYYIDSESFEYGKGNPLYDSIFNEAQKILPPEVLKKGHHKADGYYLWIGPLNAEPSFFEDEFPNAPDTTKLA